YRKCALRHGARGFVADCSELLDQIARDTKLILFCRVGVSHEAAVNDIRRAGDLGEECNEQSTRAAFSGADFETTLATKSEEFAGAIFEIGGKHLPIRAIWRSRLRRPLVLLCVR